MATTRLTNDVRDTFISGVMADVPTVDYEAKIRNAVNKAAHAALPASIKKLIADDDTVGYVAQRGVTLGRYSGIPDGKCLSFRFPAPDDKWLESIVNEAAEPFIKPWKEQYEQQHELRCKLRSIAYHCTTVKQLAEAFPEFAKYLPRDDATATRNLPALANVVSDFVKAGWPKGKK